MKIDLAIYTAQEGYAWQPGTVIPSTDLKEYKVCIGKFPSPDDPDFPFGGVFLKDDKVVFYRYHMATKIDFRGRDALYCVLGVVSAAEANKIDPRKLFAQPQFSAPMQPFPNVAEIEESAGEAVPEWLKNLDSMSLDVRITGSIEDLKFAVTQQQVKIPEPEPAPESATELPKTPIQEELDLVIPENAGKTLATVSKDKANPVSQGKEDARLYTQRFFPNRKPVSIRKRVVALAIIVGAILAILGAAVYGTIRVVKHFTGRSESVQEKME